MLHEALRTGGKHWGEKSVASQNWGEKSGGNFRLRPGFRGETLVLNVLDHLFPLLAPQAEIFYSPNVVYGLETRF